MKRPETPLNPRAGAPGTSQRDILASALCRSGSKRPADRSASSCDVPGSRLSTPEVFRWLPSYRTATLVPRPRDDSRRGTTFAGLLAFLTAENVHKRLVIFRPEPAPTRATTVSASAETAI